MHAIANAVCERYFWRVPSSHMAPYCLEVPFGRRPAGDRNEHPQAKKRNALLSDGKIAFFLVFEFVQNPGIAAKR